MPLKDLRLSPAGHDHGFCRGRLTFRLPRPRTAASAFTLIEILVVVAIIALLIAILLPSLRRAREQTKMIVCETQIGQLMKAALIYSSEFKGRLPGVGRCDAPYMTDFANGTRKDWLTWLGTFTVSFSLSSTGFAHQQAWANAPRGGRLWKYYQDDDLLRCPNAFKFNGKNSYSTPENVALAVPSTATNQDGREGIPPLVEKVAHPSLTIQFLDEDEDWSISGGSVDDGYGGPDLFADRHMGKATVAFFDGHGAAYEFPRGKKTSMIQTTEKFVGTMIQFAPYNCRYTPRPWKWRGVLSMPKFKKDANFPPDKCNWPPGCE